MHYFTKKRKHKKKGKRTNIVLLVFCLVLFVSCMFFYAIIKNTNTLNPSINNVSKIVPQLLNPSPTIQPLPVRKTLPTDYHIFQSFNNCGPAALSMALHFYGINVSQEELGNALRPYQVSSGDNDDKSVTLSELAEKSKEYGFTPYHRPMGNSEIIKKFIANDMPVITRTWTKPNEDIGHFRVVKGYDDSNQTFIQDDSLQGHDLLYTYSEFDELWKKFNYEFVVLVPDDKIEIAESILGENKSEKIAWQNAVAFSRSQLENDPNDIDARFNLSVALYNTGEYQQSINEYEKIESLLPFRTLWYQIEPIQAYFMVKNYDKVLLITEKVLNNQNRAFSELYNLRGKVYEAKGNMELADQEFEKAHFYNTSKY